jgi:protein-disulfide isomerase
VASRKQQKEEARARREQVHAQLKADQSRRIRMLTLGGVLAAAVIVAAIFIIGSSGGGSSTTPSSVKQATLSHFPTHAAAVADMETLLKGIPQSGNTLGNPGAPVTVTEFGDLVCSTCDAFALGTEPLLIADDVRTGKIKLAFRGVETSSGYANASEYVDTQVAARSAGLQNLEWNYLLLTYNEQPVEIGGKSAELVSYINSAYLQGIARQIPGLNPIKWQTGLTDPTLINDVSADTKAGEQAGVNSSPTVFVSGPKGTIEWNKGVTILPQTAQGLTQLQGLIAKVE